MILRRVVFGEPKPGMAALAKLLGGLDESVSYCNRTGPLEHDRITDYPFTVPMLLLNYQHPTPLVFTSAEPPPNDAYGIFAWHHAYLYESGLAAMVAPPHHQSAAMLCEVIYDELVRTPSFPWLARERTAGVEWGAWRDPTGPLYIVFRGSKIDKVAGQPNFLDFIRDLTAFDPADALKRVFTHPRLGEIWDGFFEGMEEVWIAIQKVIAAENPSELIITGHSLGAARASVVCGFALESR